MKWSVTQLFDFDNWRAILCSIWCVRSFWKTTKNLSVLTLSRISKSQMTKRKKTRSQSLVLCHHFFSWCRITSLQTQITTTNIKEIAWVTNYRSDVLIQEKIIEAQDYLMNVIIPEFANKLLKKEVNVRTLQELGDAAHKAGINYRFMGKVYNLVKHVSTTHSIHQSLTLTFLVLLFFFFGEDVVFWIDEMFNWIQLDNRIWNWKSCFCVFSLRERWKRFSIRSFDVWRWRPSLVKICTSSPTTISSLDNLLQV